MADTLGIEGVIEKTSDSRGSWKIGLEVSEELETDEGSRVFAVPANDSVTISLTASSPATFLVIKTPKRINVTRTYTGDVTPAPTVTDEPIRELLIVQTLGLDTITLSNPNSEDVLVSVFAGRKTDT